MKTAVSGNPIYYCHEDISKLQKVYFKLAFVNDLSAKILL
jgi:hypothetical protein